MVFPEPTPYGHYGMLHEFLITKVFFRLARTIVDMENVYREGDPPLGAHKYLGYSQRSSSRALHAGRHFRERYTIPTGPQT